MGLTLAGLAAPAVVAVVFVLVVLSLGTAGTTGPIANSLTAFLPFIACRTSKRSEPLQGNVKINLFHAIICEG